MTCSPNSLFGKNATSLTPKNSRGFTLVELLVVVVIVAVLAAVAIPTYRSYISKARITLAYGALDVARKTLEAYHVDHQQYPVDINFATGQDNLGQTVFEASVLAKFSKDLSSIDSYVAAAGTYTLTARATDDKQTLMTLTPEAISY